MPSPFPPSTSKPGHGTIHLNLLPPSTPTFSTLSYTYPLKLLPSTPHTLPTPPHNPDNEPHTPPHPTTVPLLFLLTYGGGLVAGDSIDLTIHLAPITRLTLTTQGSTKIFKPKPSTTPLPPPTTTQDLTVHIGTHAALWLAPDPVQPFAESMYAQKQVFEVERGGSLGFVDWVSEGRGARGERWAFRGWMGRNEVWDVGAGRKKLLVRDAVVLQGGDVAVRMDGMGVFGTLVLRGPLFGGLGGFFVNEFGKGERIGGRSWGRDGVDGEGVEIMGREVWRRGRVGREKRDGVLWTACFVRGCTVVKFSAREVEGARVWLGDMLREEGSVGREFGEGGMMFVR